MLPRTPLWGWSRRFCAVRRRSCRCFRSSVRPFSRPSESGSSLRSVTPETERAARTLTTTFADRLAEAVERKRSQLCVGLDPRVDLLPVELRGESVLGRAAAASAVARFCTGIIDSGSPPVVALKPPVAVLAAPGAGGRGGL